METIHKITNAGSGLKGECKILCLGGFMDGQIVKRSIYDKEFKVNNIKYKKKFINHKGAIFSLWVCDGMEGEQNT